MIFLALLALASDDVSAMKALARSGSDADLPRITAAFSSPDVPLRHQAVIAFEAVYRRVKDPNVAYKYRLLARCGKLLVDAVDDIARSDPHRAEAQLKRWIKEEHEADEAKVPDNQAIGCDLEPARPIDAAIQYVVDNRPEIARQMLDEPATTIQARLITALSAEAARDDLRYVNRLAADSNPNRRAAAVAAMGTLFYPENLNKALAAAKDPDLHVRASAMWTLRRFTSNESMLMLESGERDRSALVRTMAKNALREFNIRKPEIASE